MKVYLVLTCKVRDCEIGTTTVESVWQDEEKAKEHINYWEKNMPDWHFWLSEKELR